MPDNNTGLFPFPAGYSPELVYNPVLPRDKVFVRMPVNTANAVERKLKPGEQWVVDRKTGRKYISKYSPRYLTIDKRNQQQKYADFIQGEARKKQQERQKQLQEGMQHLNAFAKMISPSTYAGPLVRDNGRSYVDNVLLGEGTGNAVGNLLIDMAVPGAIAGGMHYAGNFKDVSALKSFLKRYNYNDYHPKWSLVFNDRLLDKAFNHTVNRHNTFIRGVNPYEAHRSGKLTNMSIEDAARYSLTHIPKATTGHRTGLMPGENGLYTSNDWQTALSYTNGEGYVGLVRRPIVTGQKTRRQFLSDNDFVFDVPKFARNAFWSTDFPNKEAAKFPEFKFASVEYPKVKPAKQDFKVRADAGASMLLRPSNPDVNAYRHYIFIGNEGDQPVELLGMWKAKNTSNNTGYGTGAIGLSRKR